MSGRIELPPLYLNETAVTPVTGWDFTKFLAQGETITGKGAVASVFSGSDPNPSLVVVSSTLSGNIVYTLLLGQTLGCIYEIKVSASTSSQQVLVLTGYLVVLPDLP